MSFLQVRKPEFSLLKAPSWEVVEAGFEATCVCSSVHLARARVQLCWHPILLGKTGGDMFN